MNRPDSAGPIGLLEGQKIEEALSRAVQRGIAVGPQIGDEQFPADGGLGQFADRNLGAPQLGDSLGQERYSKTLTDEVDDRLEIGDVEIGLAPQVRLSEGAINQRPGAPADL